MADRIKGDPHYRFMWQFKDSVLGRLYNCTEYWRYDGKGDPWDFAIFSTDDDKLVMLIAIDFGNDERDLYMPDDVQIGFIDSKDFIGSFKQIAHDLLPEYDDLVISIFLECRESGFPYRSYSKTELIDDMKSLINLSLDKKPDRSIATRSIEGDKIISYFHKSIWSAHNKDNMSPLEAWEDDEVLIKVIDNRILYKKYIDPQRVLQGLNITKAAGKVSVFSGARAKLIVDKYLSEYDVVFDPFSGFSGRMLGAFACGKKYYGQDISETHVKESNQIIEFLKASSIYWPSLKEPEVKVADVMDSHGEYDCLLTCPPYADKEQWDDVDMEKNNRPCDEWIDICMSHFKCKRYAFVVDKTSKYEDYIAEEIINASHFGTNKELLIVIPG